MLKIVVLCLAGCSLFSLRSAGAAVEEDPDANASAEQRPAADPSLSSDRAGCRWQVPMDFAKGDKKGKQKAAGMAQVLLRGVACDAVRFVVMRGDKRKAAFTTAVEGAPSSVESTPGTFAMVYPLTYRMFEADLTTGKLVEFGLPKLAFPADTRPAAVVGYNRKDALVVVATGASEDRDTLSLLRFTSGTHGWAALKPVLYKIDAEKDARELCGENFLIHAALVKDLVNVCVAR